MLTETNRIARAMNILPGRKHSGRSLSSHACVVVVGDGDHADGVVGVLDEFSMSVQRVPTVDAALEVGPGRPALYVFVAPRLGSELLRAIGRFRYAGPVILIVPQRCSSRWLRRLYEAGAQTVLEWPGQEDLLRRLVPHRLGTSMRWRDRQTEGDEVLKRSIHARLELARALLPGLELSVDEGVVELRGHVDSLWKREWVSSMIAHVPGVRAVLTADLEIVPSHRSDLAIERDTQGVLGIVLGADMKMVSFSVESGVVLLVGTVSRRDKLERALDFLANVEGVRGIRNLVTAPAT